MSLSRYIKTIKRRYFNVKTVACLAIGVILVSSTFVIITHTFLPAVSTGTRGLRKNGYVLRATERYNALNGKKSSGGNGGIPKIIHQIWSDEILPTALVDSVQGLVNNHPDWEYYLWTDKAGQKLIEDKYPFLMNVYKAEHIPQHVGLFRSDILRYVILHEYGGAYFDLDTVSLRPLDKFIQTTDCSFVVEPPEHYFFFHVDLIISNAAMICRPRHPFMRYLLDQLMTMEKTCLSPMHCTGPLFVTDVYKELNKTGSVLLTLPDVHSSELFMDVYDHPLQGARLKRICSNMTSLQAYQQNICKTWIDRGKEARKVSEKAYSYHRWYHLKYHNLVFMPENNITSVVPRVKLYGK